MLQAWMLHTTQTTVNYAASRLSLYHNNEEYYQWKPQGISNECPMINIYYERKQLHVFCIMD